MERAIGALIGLSTVFCGLCDAASQGHIIPGVQKFHEQCIQVLVERWTDVLKWMLSLVIVERGHLSRNSDPMVALCAQVLRYTVYQVCPEPSKEEFVAIPATIDFVYFLLCERIGLPSLDYYHYIPYTHTKPCEIVALLPQVMTSGQGARYLILRLKSSSRKLRHRIVRALVSRPGEIVQMHARFDSKVVGDRDAILTIQCLILCLAEILQDSFLMDVFLRSRFVHQYMTALFMFGEQLNQRREEDKPSVDENNMLWCDFCTALTTLFNSIIVRLCPNPTEVVQQAVKAGLVSSMIFAVKNASSAASCPQHGLIEVLHTASNFLPISRVFRDFTSKIVSGAPELFSHLSDSNEVLGMQIWDRWGQASRTFGRGDVQVNMCCNLKVRLSVCVSRVQPSLTNVLSQHSSELRLPQRGGDLKACSRCQLVVYCSEACQREDWVAFHSQECHQLARADRGLFLSFVRTTNTSRSNLSMR